eukprot:CAMPEP_0197258934 /NCGR_PEP_ID=MMETSP1429-20130617/83260_1 /TAXON_ID=49237 /ORGANISM="Chaetoceros  sp., Strain UNC1202" /LENGTH=116 /DNA_ID=CAMNT_0042723127 /DNA_START=1279 /DNA_END=1629 /DNA_ORIENTATION=+
MSNNFWLSHSLSATKIDGCARGKGSRGTENGSISGIGKISELCTALDGDGDEEDVTESSSQSRGSDNNCSEEQDGTLFILLAGYSSPISSLGRSLPSVASEDMEELDLLVSVGREE